MHYQKSVIHKQRWKNRKHDKCQQSNKQTNFFIESEKFSHSTRLMSSPQPSKPTAGKMVSPFRRSFMIQQVANESALSDGKVALFVVRRGMWLSDDE